MEVSELQTRVAPCNAASQTPPRLNPSARRQREPEGENQPANIGEKEELSQAVKLNEVLKSEMRHATGQKMSWILRARFSEAADGGKLQPRHTQATAVTVPAPGFRNHLGGQLRSLSCGRWGEDSLLVSRWATSFPAEMHQHPFFPVSIKRRRQRPTARSGCGLQLRKR